MPESLSVIIPTCQRVERVLQTLAIILSCNPPPAEVLVHVDAGDDRTALAIVAAFPSVSIISATSPQGPGGSRNRLIAAAKHEIVVSLDDDSFPLDPGFFTAVLSVYHDHPDAAVLAMNIAHDGEPLSRRGPEIYSVADFVGCGCVYRRSAFLELAGYVPLHPAYGMEEADLALQVIDRGWEILHANDLRVRHATSRSHQSSRKIVAAHIKNTLLLAALRYPIAMAGYALLQYANRIVYSARRGHFLGVLTGVVQTPMHLWKYRAWRAPVRASTIIATQSLRRSSALAQDRTV